ncbi:unnamed protein product, partial [Staurois parvus]
TEIWVVLLERFFSWESAIRTGQGVRGHAAPRDNQGRMKTLSTSFNQCSAGH